MEKSISLGIESSAHTFGIGIIDSDGNVLANEKAVYKPQLGKGIIPSDAAEFHKKNSKLVLANTLKKSGIDIKNIGMISYTAGAGLPPCLSVGADLAIELAKKNKKPLIKVCHQLAHLEIGRLTTKSKDPVFVYLSGGNTQIIAFSEGRYRIFGETEDIPVGNCLDIVAREMMLPMPGGPQIEKMATNGKYVELPYVVKGMNLSFSGIATGAIQLIKEGKKHEDVAYSIQETCFSMLAEVTERALAHIEKNEVLLVGGVASNKRLQEMMKMMCEERKNKFYVVPDELSGDNGVMIAWTGMLQRKIKENLVEKINPNWRVDQIKIPWI